MDALTRHKRILGFLEIIDRFKVVYRAAYVAGDAQHESDAEHTWHMCMFALLLHQELSFSVAIDHALELILTHDLVEIYAGDTYAHDDAARQTKRVREAAAAQRLFAALPGDLAHRLHSWWREFEDEQTPEAAFARAMDRLQAFAQNVFDGGRIWRERGVTEQISRAYNREAMALDPALAATFEMLYTRARRDRLWPSSDDPAMSPAAREADECA